MDANDLKQYETIIKRKPGRPAGSGNGRKVTTRSICLSIVDWDRLDAERGSLSRGEWVLSKMGNIPY
jgi:hypothetical protein